MPQPYSLTASKGQGLTQMLNAYVKKLQSEGKAEISGGKIDKKEWDATISKLADINNTRKTANQASIFTGGSDAASKDYGSNFVVQDGQQIDFDENEMNSLLASMGVTLKGQPQQAAATEPTTPVIVPAGEVKTPATEPTAPRDQNLPITLTPKKAGPIKTDTPKIDLEKRETTTPVIGNHEPEEIPPTPPVRDEVPAGTTPQIVDNGDGSRTITNPDGSRTEQRRIPRGTEETLYDNQGRKIKESKDILGPQGHDIETHFNPETGKKTKSIDKPLGDKGAAITTEFDEQGREIKKTTSQNGQSSSVENSYSVDGAQPSQTKTTYKSGNTMTETFTANPDGTKKGVRVHSNNPSVEETVNYNAQGGQTNIETRENGVLTKVEDKPYDTKNEMRREQRLNYKGSGLLGLGKKSLVSISEKEKSVGSPPATEIKFEQNRQNGNLSTIREENPITQNPITYNVGENGIQSYQMNNMTFTRNDQGGISFKQGEKQYEYKKEGDKMKLYQNGTEIEPMSQFKYERLNNQFSEGDRYLDIYKKAQQ